jgi:hypothetical protein
VTSHLEVRRNEHQRKQRTTCRGRHSFGFMGCFQNTRCDGAPSQFRMKCRFQDESPGGDEGTFKSVLATELSLVTLAHNLPLLPLTLC